MITVFPYPSQDFTSSHKQLCLRVVQLFSPHYSRVYQNGSPSTPLPVADCTDHLARANETARRPCATEDQRALPSTHKSVAMRLERTCLYSDAITHRPTHALRSNSSLIMSKPHDHLHRGRDVEEICCIFTSRTPCRFLAIANAIAKVHSHRGLFTAPCQVIEHQSWAGLAW